VIAGDTRLTDGQYGINTRYAPKVWDVGDNIVITANGYSADGDTLVKRIAQKIEVHTSPPKRGGGADMLVVPQRT
jgi:20S proteasome subunit beta 6